LCFLKPSANSHSDKVFNTTSIFASHIDSLSLGLENPADVVAISAADEKLDFWPVSCNSTESEENNFAVELANLIQAVNDNIGQRPVLLEH
jgi:hypothetical protein